MAEMTPETDHNSDSGGLIELETADAAEILDAVRIFWRETAASGMLRTCVLNLVVVMRAGASAEETFEGLARVAQTHPARVVILIRVPEFPPGTARSEITALCTLPGSGAFRSCCERILLRAAPDVFEELHQTVSELFVEYLPRYLWWQYDRFADSRLFLRLSRAVDRVILDSRRMPLGTCGLADLREAVGGIDLHHSTVTDLQWARITPWREATAQLFDVPEHLGLLNSLSSVEVTQANPEEDMIPAAALFYVAWLAWRLGWEVAGGDASRPEAENGRGIGPVALRRPDGKVLSVRMLTAPHALAEGRVTRVVLRASKPDAEFVIERSQDLRSAEILIRIGASEPVRKCVGMAPLPLYELISNELSYTERDAGYEKALPIAASILEAALA